MEEHINKFLAALILAILASTTALLKKIPQYFRERKQQTNMEKASKMDALLDDLVDKTSCIYGHIIKYHNGGDELKLGNKWHMSVVWESLGKPCGKCEGNCAFRRNPKRLQREWQRTPISSNWFKVVSKAYFDQENCHLTTYDDPILGDLGKALFERSDISSFVEYFLKVDHKSFYTLGISYCKYKTNVMNDCAEIISTAKQIKKLI